MGGCRARLGTWLPEKEEVELGLLVSLSALLRFLSRRMSMSRARAGVC